ncbi:RcnB family protein [Sphingomonas sp. CJ99]
MRKPMLMLLMAAVAMPVIAMPSAAQAQVRELRRDRQDVREERRELRQAYRRGNPREIREERRDLRRETRDLRQTQRRVDRNRAWGNNDWRDYRARNRGVYARGNWNAPFRYNRWSNGGRIAPAYYGQRYWIANPGRYRLPPARGAVRYVRHYDDVLLVDTRRGRVIQVYNNFFW